MIKVKVTVTKIEIQFPLNNFTLVWPIDTKLAVWVDYIKTHPRIATQVSVFEVKVTVTSDVPVIAKSPTSVRKIEPDATIDCCMDESDVVVIRIFLPCQRDTIQIDK